VRFEEGQERIADLLAREEPIILCAWHNRIFFLGGFLKSQLTRKGVKLTQMVSLSREGDIGYRLGKWAKLNVVRGSSNRGGSKAGAIVLPQLSGAPIYLFTLETDRCWRIKSWDRLIIPKPFAKISIRIPEPISIPRELNRGQLEEQRLQLENALNELREGD